MKNRDEFHSFCSLKKTMASRGAHLRSTTELQTNDTSVEDSSFQEGPEDSSDLYDSRRSSQDQGCIRIVAVSLLILCITLAVIDSLTEKRLEKASMDFLEWVEAHPILGLLGVILAYTIATIFFVPGSILTLGTGFAFRSASGSFIQGVALATTAVFIGATCGSICSFLLGRYLFRDYVMRLAATYPVFRAVDRALESNGLKIMILMRLSPLIPYNALDYISGVTSISLRSYTLAMVGVLPGAVTLCSIGATASSLAEGKKAASEHEGLRIFVLVFGTVFTLAGTFALSYYSKLELDKILQEESEMESPTLLSDTSMEQPSPSPCAIPDSDDPESELDQRDLS